MTVQFGDGTTYFSRDKWLVHLGYADYGKYLESDLWKEVRHQVYRNKGPNCLLCGERASQIHHNRYHEDDLSGKTLDYMNPVCRGCHEALEFTGEKKNSLQQAKSKYAKMRANYLQRTRKPTTPTQTVVSAPSPVKLKKKKKPKKVKQNPAHVELDKNVKYLCVCQGCFKKFMWSEFTLASMSPPQCTNCNDLVFKVGGTIRNPPKGTKYHQAYVLFLREAKKRKKQR